MCLACNCNAQTHIYIHLFAHSVVRINRMPLIFVVFFFKCCSANDAVHQKANVHTQRAYECFNTSEIDILHQEFIAYNFHFVIYFMRLYYIYLYLLLVFVSLFFILTLNWQFMEKNGPSLVGCPFYAFSFSHFCYNANECKWKTHKSEDIIHITT